MTDMEKAEGRAQSEPGASEPRPLEREKAAVSLIGAFILEGLAGALFFLFPVVGGALVLHALSALLFSSGIGKLRGKGWGDLAGSLAFFLPGYGLPVVMCLLMLLRLNLIPRGNILEEFKEHVNIPAEGTQERGFSLQPVGDAQSVDIKAAQASRKASLESLQAEPLIDKFNTTDLMMKRAVIDAMAKRRDRRLIAKIVECLKDPHPEIYQYALAKLSRIHEEFTSNISAALDQVERDSLSVRARADLVRLYIDYMETGLVDETLQEYYTDQIVNESLEILRLSPRDSAARFTLARIYMKQEKFDEALGQYKKILSRQARNFEAHFGIVEALYGMGNYPEMIREIRSILSSGFTKKGADKNLMETAQWWLMPHN
jgi:hypothetical protein